MQKDYKPAQACSRLHDKTLFTELDFNVPLWISFAFMFPFISSRRSLVCRLFSHKKYIQQNNRLELLDRDVCNMWFVGLKHAKHSVFERSAFKWTTAFHVGCRIQITLNKLRKNKYLQETNYLCLAEYQIWTENIPSISILKNAFFIILECHAWFSKPCLINQCTWVTCTSSGR